MPREIGAYVFLCPSDERGFPGSYANRKFLRRALSLPLSFLKLASLSKTLNRFSKKHLFLLSFLLKCHPNNAQHEAAAKRAEMDAYAQQMRSTNIEKEAEEARKTLDAQTQHERHRAEYQDELERKRQVDMLQAQKYMQE